MKSLIGFILFTCIVYDLNAQVGKNMFISMGIAYRQYPLSKQNVIRQNIYGFRYSPMWNTTALSIDIGDSISINNKKIAISIDNYLRYTPWIDKQNGMGSLKKGFMHDHLLNLKYPFKIKKSNLNYIIGLGIGVMNFGSKFTYSYYTGSFDNNGNPIKASRKSNFVYYSSNLTLGLQTKKISLYLVSHLANRDDYFDKHFSFWGEGKLTYTINICKK